MGRGGRQPPKNFRTKFFSSPYTGSTVVDLISSMLNNAVTL